MNSFFEEIENFISEGSVIKAIKQIIEVLRQFQNYCSDDISEIMNDIILFSSKFQNVEKDIHSSLLDYSAGQIEKSKIINALLGAITLLKRNKEFVNFANNPEAQQKREPEDEEKVWARTMRSNDVVSFQEYQKMFPNGVFFRVAQKCLSNLQENENARLIEEKDSNQIIAKIFRTDLFDEILYFQLDKLEDTNDNVDDRFQSHKIMAISSCFSDLLNSNPFGKKEKMCCFKQKDEIYYSFFGLAKSERVTSKNFTQRSTLTLSELYYLELAKVLTNSFQNNIFHVNWSKSDGLNKYPMQISFAKNNLNFDSETIDKINNTTKIIQSYIKDEFTYFLIYGEFTFANSVKLINTVVETLNKNANIKNLHFILSEMLQNILQQSDEEKGKKGLVKIQRENTLLIITTANFINRKSVKEIVQKIDYINDLNEKELNAYHDYCIYASETDSNTVGLSLSEIKLMTNRKISVDIIDYDEVSKILGLKVEFKLEFKAPEIAHSYAKYSFKPSLHIEPIEPSYDTPKIYFEPEVDLFVIEGKSLPENAIGFYQPVFDWAEKYLNSDNAPTPFVLNFKMQFFNTASSKQIAKLLRILECCRVNESILIKWYYDKEDTDMLKAGTRYSKLFKLKFEFPINVD